MSFRKLFLFCFERTLCHLFMKRKENVQGKLSESAVYRCPSKSLNIDKKTLVLESLFSKAASLKGCIFIKKSIAKFIYEYLDIWILKYCKIFKNNVMWNTFRSLYFSEILCDDRILWTSLGAKFTFFIFLVLLPCFIIPSPRTSSNILGNVSTHSRECPQSWVIVVCLYV